MYGALLGDMIGAPYEFSRSMKTKEFPLFIPASGYTDDSVMTVAVTEALLEQEGRIESIVGYVDAMKVRSCMTLFREADPDIPVFGKVLDKFYDGQPDERTLEIILV